MSASRRPALLAVDGGGSKLDAVLLRKDGTVLGAARIEPDNLDESGGDGHMANIVEVAEAASTDAGLDPSQRPVARLGVYCLAGADLPQDDRRIARELRKTALSHEDLVKNDTFAVLRAGTNRGWGVAVVCGHGTNCTGLSPAGRAYRLPAVGPISGDWGGGGDIGTLAVWHAVRGRDGRGDRTSLERLVPEYFHLGSPRQVVKALYLESVSEDRVDELAPIVFRAALDGDAVARSIVDRQADEIVTMASAAIRRLRMTRLDVDVVLGGGIFRNEDPSFFARIQAGLSAVAQKATIHVLTDPPLIGAALLGLDAVRAPRAAHEAVRTALTHDRVTAHTSARRS